MGSEDEKKVVNKDVGSDDDRGAKKEVGIKDEKSMRGIRTVRRLRRWSSSYSREDYGFLAVFASVDANAKEISVK